MQRRLELKDLRLIRYTAETGSLTGAAHNLHVTQSAASQRLAAIQKRLNLTLFEKAAGGWRATAAGERLVEAARRVEAELERSFDDIRRAEDAAATRIRIATQCYTCYRWLPFVIRSVHARHPDTTVDVAPEATEAPYEALRDSRIDVAIVSDPRPPGDLRSERLFDDELLAVMAGDHPLAKRQFVTPANFRDEAVIVYTGRRHAIVEEILRPAGRRSPATGPGPNHRGHRRACPRR